MGKTGIAVSFVDATFRDINFVEVLTSRNVRFCGKLDIAVTPGGANSPVNPELVKSGNLAILVARRSSVVKEEGKFPKGIAVIPGGAKVRNVDNEDKFCKVVILVAARRSRLVKEEGKDAKDNAVIPGTATPRNPDNPDKSGNLVILVLLMSSEVNEVGKFTKGNVVIPAGAFNSSNPVIPVNPGNLVIFVDGVKSSLCNVLGKFGNAVIPGGVINVCNELNEDKSGKAINFV